jgi:hypothetical protein
MQTGAPVTVEDLPNDPSTATPSCCATMESYPCSTCR